MISLTKPRLLGIIKHCYNNYFNNKGGAHNIYLSPIITCCDTEKRHVFVYRPPMLALLYTWRIAPLNRNVVSNTNGVSLDGRLTVVKLTIRLRREVTFM